MQNKRAARVFIFLTLALLAAAAAPYLDGGLPGILKGMGEGLEISWCPDTPKAVAISFVISFFICTGIGNDSDRELSYGEFGSAKWGDVKSISSKYAPRGNEPRKILTRNVSISLDGKRHRRNLNVLVCGGSGSGKTRFYAKPNVMNADCSMVVLDPKGEIVRSCGRLLEEKGYTVKVIDLINMERSSCYNPFFYLEDDNDVQRMCTNLFANTTPKQSRGADPFWDKAAMMLLLAIVFYLLYEAPPYEQNFAMVMDMIRAGEIDEDHVKEKSVLDNLFDRLPPDHIARKYYESYRSGSGKTLKSIQISLISHLEKFNLKSVATITCSDDLELDTVGEKKTAIFAVTPENDTSFNFLIGMLYTQLFQRLYYIADKKYHGALPVHVHFNMDEFANVPLPEDFDKILSTMRSRGISVSIIIQNMAQLKNLFKDEWESIVGNCDEFLYLGGNEYSTHEYVSKLIGKETVKYVTHSKSKGRGGSYNENEYVAARSLLNPDEVRTLDNGEAILFIRGENPVKDRKYEIMRHPNIMSTEDGGAEAYTYGCGDYCMGTIETSWEISAKSSENTTETVETDENRYEILSDLSFREEMENNRREEKKKEDEKAGQQKI